MGFLLSDSNWILVIAAMVSAALLAMPRMREGGGDLDPADAVQRINRDRALVVDVRSSEEFAGGHVVRSKNVPLEALEDQLPRIVKNRQRPLILVCSTGRRSGRAVAVVRKLGYEDVQSLTGGLKAWVSEDLPLAGDSSAA